MDDETNARGPMRVTLPYPPSANRYWRMWKNRMVVSTEARKYKRCAAELALASGMKPLSGDVVVRLAVYRPARRGDLDNVQKVLLDSVRGIAFHDDSQVVRIEASRFEDKDNPRVEFEVEQAGTQLELLP